MEPLKRESAAVARSVMKCDGPSNSMYTFVSGACTSMSTEYPVPSKSTSSSTCRTGVPAIGVSGLGSRA